MDDDNIIITTEAISRKTIKSIVNGMGYERVVRFVQDGDCGSVVLQEYDGSRVMFLVLTLEAAKLYVGATL